MSVAWKRAGDELHPQEYLAHNFFGLSIWCSSLEAINMTFLEKECITVNLMSQLLILNQSQDFLWQT